MLLEGGGGVRTERFRGWESVRADLSWEDFWVSIGLEAGLGEARVEDEGWEGATGTGICRLVDCAPQSSGMFVCAGRGAHINKDCDFPGLYLPLSRIRFARSSLRSSSRFARATETGLLRVEASRDCGGGDLLVWLKEGGAANCVARMLCVCTRLGPGEDESWVDEVGSSPSRLPLCLNFLWGL